MLAAFMDFGVGVLIGALLCRYYRIPATILFLFLAGAAALIPDFDLVLSILNGEIKGDHHQLLTHTPLFIIPVVMLIGLLWGKTVEDPRILPLLTIGVLWHLLHDSPELGGGGIRWAWPHTNWYLTLSGGWINPATLAEGSTPKLWGSPNAFAIREICIGSVALVAAAWIARRELWLGAGIVACVWVCTATLWNMPLIPLVGGSAMARP
jgi:hypothetical protein